MSSSTERPQRRLADVAADVARDWKKPYFGARPYLQAMGELETVKDLYGMEDGRAIVLGFLANAQSWKGDDARRIKVELTTMVTSGLRTVVKR